MPTIRFVVPGISRPQGSKRPVRMGEHIRLIEQSERLPAWRERVTLMARQATLDTPFYAPKGTPVALRLTFVFQRPGAHWHKGRKRAGELRADAPAAPIGKGGTSGDIDKLERAVLDSLTSVLYDDDCQVWSVQATKEYGPRAELVVVAEA